VRATLEKMREFVNHGKKQPVIREKATALTQNLEQKNYLAEIAALHQFVRDEIRYVRDPANVEMLHWPERVLEQRHGDCDDKSVLLAALLESIGHPTRFVAVGFRNPNEYSHVFVDTYYRPSRGWAGRPGWMTLETTENVPMGWRPPGIVAALPWY
jgi:transglutaminase-like putative cysteine protease